MEPTEYPFYATGTWQPFPGQDEAFIAAWEEFAGWGAGLDGAGEAILTRDTRDEGRYVSFFGWNDMGAMRAWKEHPEFKERMGRVQQLIDKFAPTELELVSRAKG
jgi:heme-degrading monooxygenase HmoA